MVEGVDENGAAALGERDRLGERLLQRVPDQMDLGAVSPGRGELWQRGAPGMNTVASAPTSLAPSATPCAWLPALAATPPRGAAVRSDRGSARTHRGS
jgi:hypothetical protein